MKSKMKTLLIFILCFFSVTFILLFFCFLKDVSSDPGGPEANVNVKLTVTIGGAGGSTITIGPRTTNNDPPEEAEAGVGTEINPSAEGSYDIDETLDGK